MGGQRLDWTFPPALPPGPPAPHLPSSPGLGGGWVTPREMEDPWPRRRGPGPDGSPAPPSAGDLGCLLEGSQPLSLLVPSQELQRWTGQEVGTDA